MAPVFLHSFPLPFCPFAIISHSWMNTAVPVVSPIHCICHASPECGPLPSYASFGENLVEGNDVAYIPSLLSPRSVVGITNLSGHFIFCWTQTLPAGNHQQPVELGILGGTHPPSPRKSMLISNRYSYRTYSTVQ